MQLGIDNFLANHIGEVTNKKVALLTNMTGINENFISTVSLLDAHAEIRLVKLFAPEHGIYGVEKEGEIISAFVDEKTGLKVESLYTKNKKPTKEQLNDVDIVICDLQDIGTRFYTFIYTIINMMIACQENGKEVIILDRPNPVNGVKVEGKRLDMAFRSFIGDYRLPVRHGMTVGEIALMVNAEFDINADLKVIPLIGWNRNTFYDETSLPWVMPTPNSTGIDMALLYPGTCLIEGTNLSEGRGTTKPFELIGAPFINGQKLADKLNNKGHQGVMFRPAVFKPYYQKYEGQLCEGVQVHITDRHLLDSFSIGISIIQTACDMYPDQFKFVKNADFQNQYMIDLLAGTDQLRAEILRGDIRSYFNSIPLDIANFKREREPYLLY